MEKKIIGTFVLILDKVWICLVEQLVACHLTEAKVWKQWIIHFCHSKENERRYSVVLIGSSPNEMVQFEKKISAETHSTQEYMK